MLRTKSLAALSGAALLLGACGGEPTAGGEADAGGVVCASGEAARFGRCFCASDLGCSADEYCEAVTGQCRPRPSEPADAGAQSCIAGALRCAPAPGKAIERCDDAAWNLIESCADDGFCAQGPQGYFCAICSPGLRRCSGASAFETCSDLGDEWRAQTCPNLPGMSSPGACVGGNCQVCVPQKLRCSDDGAYLETCQADGLAWQREYCPVTGRCSPGGAVPVCVPPVCTPGAQRCRAGSNTAIEVCKRDGSGWEARDCRAFDDYSTPAAVCRNSACSDPCADAARASSYQGCEYWATATTNSLLPRALFKGGAYEGSQPTEPSEYAIVVSNPDKFNAVKVSVTRKVGNAEVTAPSRPAADANGQITVPAGRLQVIRLPWQVVSATGQEPFAYHLVSSAPISAYQFNPVTAYTGSTPQYSNGACQNCSLSNDASLLIPAHILGSSYVVLAQEHITLAVQEPVPYLASFPSFFSVVGVEDATEVTIRFASATEASRSGTPIAAQAAGSTATYRLNRFDVLQFWSDAGGQAVECSGAACRYDSDPTGTMVLAERAGAPAPVAVFAGADCTFKPYDKFACDHVEEMMVPFSAWGKNYVGVKSAAYLTESGSAAGNPAPDRWRIVAGCGARSCPAGTRFTIAPAPLSVSRTGVCTGGSCSLPPVGAGQVTAPWVEFVHAGNFTVSSDQPIMLAQYFTGQEANNAPGCGSQQSCAAKEGDPSMILTPPVEQWRKEYNVLTSPTYKHNYLALVSQSASPNILINGLGLTVGDFPGFTSTSLGSYRLFTVPIPVDKAGALNITSQAKVGVTVYGYDVYVSYGYTGGLDLLHITQINPGG